MSKRKQSHNLRVVERAETPEFAMQKLTPRTKNQKKFIDSVLNNHITFGFGAAGTGKTYVAGVLAAQALASGLCKKIVISRPAIQSFESIGHLPGDANEKMAPYIASITEAVNETFFGKHKNAFNYFLGMGTIEIVPLSFMRGRSFKDCYIILDEMQGASADCMKMVLTRIGENSKMIITGDPEQRDKAGMRGYEAARDRLGHLDKIGFIEFGVEDVVRHPIVRDILEAWDE